MNASHRFIDTFLPTEHRDENVLETSRKVGLRAHNTCRIAPVAFTSMHFKTIEGSECK